MWWNSSGAGQLLLPNTGPSVPVTPVVSVNFMQVAQNVSSPLYTNVYVTAGTNSVTYYPVLVTSNTTGNYPANVSSVISMTGNVLSISNLLTTGDVTIVGNLFCNNNVIFNDTILLTARASPAVVTRGISMQRPAGNVMIAHLSTEAGGIYANTLVLGYTFGNALGTLLPPDTGNSLNVYVTGAITGAKGLYGNMFGSNTISASQITIANTTPNQLFSVGANVYICDTQSNTIVTRGNVSAAYYSGNAALLTSTTDAAPGTYTYPSITVSAGGRISSVTSGSQPVSNGTAGQVAYYTNSNTVSGDIGMTYSNTIGTLTLTGGLTIGGDLKVSGNTYSSNNIVFNDAVVLISNNTPNVTTRGMLMQRPAGNIMAAYLSTESGSAYMNTMVFGYTFGGAQNGLLTPDTGNSLPVSVIGSVTASNGFYGTLAGSNTVTASTLITSGNVSIGNTATALSTLVVGSNLFVRDTAANVLTISGNLSAGYLFGNAAFLTGVTLSTIVNNGNTTSNTVQFTNLATSLVASGNVVANNFILNSSNIQLGASAGLGQGSGAIAIGTSAGQYSQNAYSIAIGSNAGQSYQTTYAVAMGYFAGQINQNTYSVAIGANAGQNNQNSYAVAIGHQAGLSNQSSHGVAIGYLAGVTTQNTHAVAIGSSAGNSNQGLYSVAIGLNAGKSNQGNNSVAIGNSAGITSQANNSIILNANGGTDLSSATTGFFVKPVIARITTFSNVVTYNKTTGEFVTTDLFQDTAGNLNLGGNSLLGTGNIQPTSNNSASIGTTSLRYSTLWTTNGTISGSDERHKVSVPLVYGLNEILQVETVKYKWNSGPDTDTQYYGVLAQQIDPILPELIYKDNPGFWSINYTELVPVCINAIKDLNTKISCKGSVQLNNGTGLVNIDGSITNPHYFLQNTTSYDPVIGSLSPNNVLTITCQNTSSNAIINYRVI